MLRRTIRSNSMRSRSHSGQRIEDLYARNKEWLSSGALRSGVAHYAQPRWLMQGISLWSRWEGATATSRESLMMLYDHVIAKHVTRFRRALTRRAALLHHAGEYILLVGYCGLRQCLIQFRPSIRGVPVYD